jgi:hypothetical protein
VIQAGRRLTGLEHAQDVLAPRAPQRQGVVASFPDGGSFHCNILDEALHDHTRTPVTGQFHWRCNFSARRCTRGARDRLPTHLRQFGSRYRRCCLFTPKGGPYRMSHIVTIQTRLHDPGAIAAACQRLQLPAPVQGTTQLFSGAATGLIVQLPGWLYPVVLDTQSGTVQLDNYGGRWGEQNQFDRFLQLYAVEKTKLEAR